MEMEIFGFAFKIYIVLKCNFLAAIKSNVGAFVQLTLIYASIFNEIYGFFKNDHIGMYLYIQMSLIEVFYLLEKEW